MYRKRLMMDQIRLSELWQFAVARRPRLSCFQRRPFGLADRDHLFCMRARQLSATGQSTAPADGSEIVAQVRLRFFHFNARRSCIISSLWCEQNRPVGSTNNQWARHRTPHALITWFLLQWEAGRISGMSSPIRLRHKRSFPGIVWTSARPELLARYRATARSIRAGKSKSRVLELASSDGPSTHQGCVCAGFEASVTARKSPQEFAFAAGPLPRDLSPRPSDLLTQPILPA